VASAESVALIERGGVVEHSSEPAMQLVKHGGALAAFTNPNGVVFHEPGAILGPKLVDPLQRTTRSLITVRHITANPGVGPFIYQAAPRPKLEDAPAVSPQIRSVSPRAAGAGDVITLDGKGFARTTEVLFLDLTPAAPHKAGFRVVSDQQLRVEVPDQDARTGPQLVAVVTTEGLTITIPRDRTIRLAVVGAYLGAKTIPPGTFVWVAPGDVIPSVGHQLTFIARGGLVNQGGLGGGYFVQRNGGLAEGNGIAHAAFVYYEAGALIPERLKKSPNAHEVRAIVPSPVAEPFAILPGPLFRR
jgi:hypothetical protein